MLNGPIFSYEDVLFFKKEAENELKNLEELKIEFENRIIIIDNTQWRYLAFDEYNTLCDERRDLYRKLAHEVPEVKRDLERFINMNEKYMTFMNIYTLFNKRNFISNRLNYKKE